MDADRQRSDVHHQRVAEQYNMRFEAQSNSPTLRRIWAEVYGEDYPADTDPYSYVTVTDLEWFVRELRVAPEDTFADLACGRGGPGLWVLQKNGRVSDRD